MEVLLVAVGAPAFLVLVVYLLRSAVRSRTVSSESMWFWVALATAQVLRLVQDVPTWAEESFLVRLSKLMLVCTAVFAAGGFVVVRHLGHRQESDRPLWVKALFMVPILFALAPLAPDLMLGLATAMAALFAAILFVGQVQYLRGASFWDLCDHWRGSSQSDEEQVPDRAQR